MTLLQYAAESIQEEIASNIFLYHACMITCAGIHCPPRGQWMPAQWMRGHPLRRVGIHAPQIYDNLRRRERPPSLHCDIVSFLPKTESSLACSSGTIDLINGSTVNITTDLIIDGRELTLQKLIICACGIRVEILSFVQSHDVNRVTSVA